MSWRHARSPTSAALAVDSTMSVNSTVARMRSAFWAAWSERTCSSVQVYSSTNWLSGAAASGS